MVSYRTSPRLHVFEDLTAYSLTIDITNAVLPHILQSLRKPANFSKCSLFSISSTNENYSKMISILLPDSAVQSVFAQSIPKCNRCS